jgi:hypothetical protein
MSVKSITPLSSSSGGPTQRTLSIVSCSLQGQLFPGRILFHARKGEDYEPRRRVGSQMFLLNCALSCSPRCPSFYFFNKHKFISEFYWERGKLVRSAPAVMQKRTGGELQIEGSHRFSLAKSIRIYRKTYIHRPFCALIEQN